MADGGYYPRRGLHGRLVDSLGRAIATGAYAPGDPLDVAALQAERAVSKTALREALRVLAGKGLVDARQKRGTIVAPVGAWNLLDPDVLRWQAGADMLEALAEVRAIVEPPAARLAAERRTDADLEALEQALAAMVGSAADPVAHAAADVAFHRALLRASGNELLGRIGGVFEAVLRARDELVHRAGHRDDFREPHAAVLAAIRERRPQRAHDAMGELLAKSRADALAAASAGTERLGAPA
jgi:GntR family transcriptional regulator, galactonate operon transcriptional repressor